MPESKKQRTFEFTYECLLLCCRDGRMKDVETLLAKQEIVVKLKRDWVRMPLVLAVENKHRQIVLRLLELNIILNKYKQWSIDQRCMLISCSAELGFSSQQYMDW